MASGTPVAPPTPPSPARQMMDAMFNHWRVQAQDAMVNNITKLTHNLAHTVDRVLSSMPDSAERDRALRKLISAHAPTPVPGSEWSLINSVDFDFVGFSGHHLSDFTMLHSLPHIPSSSMQLPLLLVIQNLSLAAKLSYEDPVLIEHVCKTWNMTTSSDMIFSKEMRAFIMHDDHNIVLTFRGTEIINPKDWSTDVKLKFTTMIPRASNGAMAEIVDEASATPKLVHFGFYHALGLTASYEGESPYTMVYDALQKVHAANSRRKIWITGHSLGGALASVFVAQLLLDNETELLQHLGGLHTFGQPRSGNDAYAKLFDGLSEQGLVYRTVNKTDLVCKVPLQITKYEHHGTEVLITSEKLSMTCKGETIERVATITHEALSPNSSLKKMMFALLPNTLEDHYPSEYVRNIQLFI